MSNPLIGALAALACLVACSRPATPSFALDATLAPTTESIGSPFGDETRPVAALGAPDHALDFVEDEAVVVLAPGDDPAAIATRMGGTVVRRIDLGGTEFDQIGEDGVAGFVLIRVDRAPAATGAELERLARQAAKDGEEEAGGDLRVSSQAGLDLLAAVARESVEQGVRVGVNFLMPPSGVSERSTEEAPASTQTGGLSDTWSSDAFDWPYMQRGNALDIGAAEAARLLVDSGRAPTTPSDRVEVAIIDGGFASTVDVAFAEILPSDAWDVPNPNDCSGGNPCPWHGTMVASALAGRLDDRAGAAGPAADVAYPLLVTVPGGNLWDWLEFFFVTLPRTAARRPPILNMSMSGDIPAGACLIGICTVADIAALKVRQSGTLVIASAGNDGRDVDAEDCFVACWEEAYRFPCEAPGVLCVGGLAYDEPEHWPGSAYGSDERSSSASVDLYAPFSVWVHDTPDGGSTNAQLVSGTSFSAPFVAAVAALAKAADPGLSAGELHDLLLSTAHTRSDTRVHRWVDARAAVVAALGGDAPPFVQIQQPLEGSRHPWRASTLPLECLVEDDSAALIVRWFSDREGEISDFGPRANVPTDLALGRHAVWCTVSDGTFEVASELRTIQVVNNDPVVELRLPVANASPYAGQPIEVKARALDVNANLVDVEMFVAPLSGGPVAWRATDVDLGRQIGNATGLVPPGTLEPGRYEAVANASDDQGRFGGATVRFDVRESPDNLPPTLLDLAASPSPASHPSDRPSQDSFRAVDCLTDVNGAAAGNGFCRRIRFSADAWDDRDAPSELAWSWTLAEAATPLLPFATASDVGGLSYDLPDGDYVVRLRVTDSGGATSDEDVGVWAIEITSLF